MANRKNTNNSLNLVVKPQEKHELTLTKNQKIAKFSNFVDSLNENDMFDFAKYTLASNSIDIQDNKALLKIQQLKIDDLSAKIADLEVKTKNQPIHVAKAVIVPCIHFKKGSCKNGNNCQYSHENPTTKEVAAPCIHFKKGSCKNGNNCNYRHENPVTNAVAAPCIHFKKGSCKNGTNCKFTH